jgi:hypothetical protein
MATVLPALSNISEVHKGKFEAEYGERPNIG